MTLDRAIKVLNINNDHNPDITDAERREAVKLGIEALKRVTVQRKQVLPWTGRPLPGETID